MVLLLFCSSSGASEPASKQTGKQAAGLDWTDGRVQTGAKGTWQDRKEIKDIVGNLGHRLANGGYKLERGRHALAISLYSRRLAM